MKWNRKRHACICVVRLQMRAGLSGLPNMDLLVENPAQIFPYTYPVRRLYTVLSDHHES